MPIRRHCDPVNVKRIWDAIRSITQSHQTADVTRITKYLQSINDCTPAQAELYIKQSYRDKLIISSKKNETSYKIPQKELPELDGKDWYCFECHLAGDVTLCNTCFRVFHTNCISGGKRKFEFQKKSTNYPKATVDKSRNHSSGGLPVTIVCDESDVLNSSQNVRHSAEADSGGDIATNSTNVTNQPWKNKRNVKYDPKLCSVCNIFQIDYNCEMEKDEINYMLRFVLHRIRSWLPNTITHTMAAEDRPDWLTDKELTWRANQLFFEHRDMSVIEVKLNTETYTTFSEFLADVCTVQHNVAIFHGIESQEYGAAELMLRDTIHDIAEMKNCVDCYKHSNEKINNKWFCLPCRVPHQLVWAKQKGYPYWPAKVIKVTSTHYDVRFFGGKYERAILLKSMIKPIAISKENLQIKSSSAFTKAYEELKFHQLLLNDPIELEKLKALSKPRRRTLSKQKNSLLTTPPCASKNKNNNATLVPQSAEDNGQDLDSLPSTPLNNSIKRKLSNCISLEDNGTEKKSKTVDDEQNSNNTISGNVIDISDGEEEESSREYSFRENSQQQENFNFEEPFEQVTSSTENVGKQISPNAESGMQPLDQPYSDSVEKMRRKLECLTNTKDIIKCAMDSMQMEIDSITNEHNEHLKRLFESHNQQISETKKKQWCYNCEQDAIYHCCWNTAYCSQTCQQQHWQAEHKKVCRRKR